jgi:beta-glucosidase
VILATPDAVEMPWIGDVGAVLAGFFAGQGAGYATASAVFGESNPSGKLTVTFPVHLEDVPGYLSYPGENGRHVYSEGIHVGYRYYDARRMEPLFPFGFGLSYTRFAYSNLSIDADRIAENSRFTVSFDITNTGKVAGKEIAQLYSRPHAPRLHRPLRELKGFAKVSLEPGETKRVGIAVDAQDLRYFDPEYKAWLLDAGDVTIEIGASSRDIHLEKTLPVLAAARPSTRLDVESQPYLVLENPLSRERFIAFLQEELEIDAIEAGKVLEYCSTSFLGIHNTVAWFAGDRISKTSMSHFLDSLNKELNAAA